MSKKNTTAVATKEVSEVTIALALQQHWDDANRTIAQKAIIFGATFIAAGRELERRGLLGGFHKKGDGLQGWLADHCPSIAYKTAMRWRQIAEAQVAALQSKGVGSEDDAIKILQGRDDEIEKPAPKKAVALRDEIYSVPSIRKLTQGWFDFGDGCEAGKHRGRPKGTKADLSKKPDSTDTIAAARAVWSQVIVPAEKTFPALESAVKLLNAADVENAKIILQNLMDLLNEQEKALKPNIH